MHKKLIGALVGVVLSSAFSVQAAGVTDAMIANDARAPNNVLSWGMGTQGQRFSPLTQINTATVSRLTPAWSMSFGGVRLPIKFRIPRAPLFPCDATSAVVKQGAVDLSCTVHDVPPELVGRTLK